MARLFFAGHEYSQYLTDGGLPFKEDIFYQCKCECIEQSKFEECACPICTVARETVREWDRQRALWYKEAGGACSCGACGKDSPYRLASRSFSALRAFLHAPCGKQSLGELIISKGPKSCETVEMYRRQCCRVPLPEISDALEAVAAADAATAAAAEKRRAKASKTELEAADKAASVATAKATAKAAKAGGYTPDEIRSLANCDKCGLAACMPRCPVEWDDSKPATWKEWRAVPQPDGKSYRAELRTITGTRKGLMERIETVYTDGDPHQWIDTWLTSDQTRDLASCLMCRCLSSLPLPLKVPGSICGCARWQAHQRHLIYGTAGDDELCISTDFSAQFDHKCAWTLTCEHPPRRRAATPFLVPPQGWLRPPSTHNHPPSCTHPPPPSTPLHPMPLAATRLCTSSHTPSSTSRESVSSRPTCGVSSRRSRVMHSSTTRHSLRSSSTTRSASLLFARSARCLPARADLPHACHLACTLSRSAHAVRPARHPIRTPSRPHADPHAIPPAECRCTSSRMVVAASTRASATFIGLPPFRQST